MSKLRIVFRNTLPICFILILSLLVLVSCGDDDPADFGDDDPADKWVGTWTLKTWDGEDFTAKTVAENRMSLFKYVQSAKWGPPQKRLEMFDKIFGEPEVAVKFTFDNSSRWEYEIDITFHLSSYIKKNRNNPYIPECEDFGRREISNPNCAAKLEDLLEERAIRRGVVATGSYIVTDDSFIMTGDKTNKQFKGRMSGMWNRSGSKITLIGDTSRFGTIVLSK